jgi:hypothetical protein
MKLPDHILSAIAECVADGASATMRRHEVARGHELVLPGTTPWLPAADWDPGIVVSITGRRRVRIVAIYARQPGTGAFSRMVDGILLAGLHPLIVEPTGIMDLILDRWGWHQRTVGKSFRDRETQWFPTAGWKAARLNRRA